MANFAYTPFKADLLQANIDFDLPHDIRVLLVMTNTTVDTQEDVGTISGFTTLDEYDGASYARQALTGETVNEDATNNRGEFDAADAQFATLGVGTRQCQAAVVYRHVTNDTDSIPLAYIDTGGFPFDGNGGNVDLQWNAEGIIQAT